MPISPLHLTFTEVNINTEIPYDLLLLADPSKELVDSYTQQSQIFVAKIKNDSVGGYRPVSII